MPQLRCDVAIRLARRKPQPRRGAAPRQFVPTTAFGFAKTDLTILCTPHVPSQGGLAGAALGGLTGWALGSSAASGAVRGGAIGAVLGAGAAVLQPSRVADDRAMLGRAGGEGYF